MAQGVKAGQAFVELFSVTSKFEAGLKRAQKRLNAFGDMAIKIGSKLTALSGILATPFLAAIKVTSDFETAMARVNTVLKATPKELSNISMEVRRMAVSSGQSATDLALGLNDIVQASFNGAEAMHVLGAAAKAAVGGTTDTATAAKGIIGILNAFNIKASAAEDVADLLFATVFKGVISFEALAQNLGNVTGFAASSGLAIEEMTAAIASMTRNTIGAEESVTSLRAIVAAFLKPTDRAAEAAKRFGFVLSSSTLKAEGLVSVLEKLRGATSDEIAEVFPNIRAIKGAQPLLKDFDGFLDTLQSMRERSGNAEAAFKEMSGTLAFVFRQIRRAGEEALLIIGTTIAPQVRNLGEAIVKAGAKLNSFLKRNRQLILVALQIVKSIGAAGLTLVGFGIALKVLAAAVGGAALVIGTLTGILASILTPITLITIAVGALATHFVKKFGLIEKAVSFFKDVMNRLEATFSGAFMSIIDSLKSGNVEGAFKVLSKSVDLIWSKMIEKLTQSWELFKGRLSQIAGPLREVFVQAALIAFDAFSFVIERIKNMIKEIGGSLVRALIKATTIQQLAMNRVSHVIAKLIINFDSDISAKDAQDMFKTIDQVGNSIEKKLVGDFVKSLSFGRDRTKDQAAEDLIINTMLQKRVGLQEKLNMLLDKATNLKSKVSDEGAKNIKDAKVAVQDASKALADEVARQAARTSAINKKLDEEANKPAPPKTNIPTQSFIKDLLGGASAIGTELAAVGSFSGLGLERGSEQAFQNESIRLAREIAKNTKNTVKETKKNNGGTFR